MSVLRSQDATRQPAVALITHSYYLRDPRVRREAETLRDAGYDVDVICLRRPEERGYEEIDGVRVYRLPLEHRRTSKLRYVAEYLTSPVLAFALLTWLDASRRYSLVQVHTPPDLLVFAGAWCKLRGVPLIHDNRDPMPEVMGTKLGVPQSHIACQLMAVQEQISAAFATYCITVTELVMESMIERGIPRDKITTIMNYADPTRFASISRERPRRINQDRPTLLFMGTLLRQYGVDILLDALVLLREEIPGIRLKVVGDGEDKPALIEQVTALGLDDCVSFHASVPIHQLPFVALPADIGIAPHRVDVLYNVCFPMKIYDYLMLGLPVVAARTKSLVHYYGEKTLTLVEPENPRALADGILEVIRSPERVREMHELSTQFLDQHNWNLERERFLAIIDHFAGATARSKYGAQA